MSHQRFAGQLTSAVIIIGLALWMIWRAGTHGQVGDDGGDLIQQHDRGLLGDGAGNQHALPLRAGSGVAGSGADSAVSETIDTGFPHRFADDLYPSGDA